MTLASIIKTTLLTLASATLVGAESPFPAMQSLTVPLTGRAETNFAHPSGGTGDPDGSGTVKLVITPVDRQVCFDFRLARVSDPLMAHIRKAPRLMNGPPIVSLFTGIGSSMDGCAEANTGQLAEMIVHPSDFYVSVSTTEFPDGALRGQL